MKNDIIDNNIRKNNLLYQTKSILNYFKNNSSNFHNINYENKKKNKISKYSNDISKKNEKSYKKNEEEIIDIFLNYDYSRKTNKDKNNGQYYFKQKKNNISYVININENKENKNISNIQDIHFQKNNNKILINNVIKDSTIKNKENISNIFLRDKDYFLDNEINIKENNNNKYLLDFETDYNNKYNINNQKNLTNNYEMLNNNDKYISNNSNKKKITNQNYTNINKSLTNNYNYDYEKNIENKYIDSLENSEEKDYKPSSKLIKKSKYKYHYNINLKRNLQDQIFPYKTNNNFNNNTTIDFNNKDKEESNNLNNLNKTDFIKENNNNYNHNRPSLVSKNDLSDIDNDCNYANKLNELYSDNYHSSRCPKCNCFNNKKKVENSENKNYYDNFYKNEINSFDSSNNQKINNKHFSLPKNILNKEISLNLDYGSHSNFLENNSNNDRFIFNNKNDVKINYEKESNYSKYNSFYNLLLDIIKQDNSIEKIRQQLSVREDVNLMDLFKLFNHSSNSLLSSLDFSKALKEFGLLLNNEDTKYLFRKYGKNLNDFLDYEEFCDIILPKKYSSAKIMSEKNSKEKNYNISEETKRIICSLFKNIIDGEKSNENYRKRIGSNGEYSGLNLFNKIKKNYSVGIYKEDISKFMKKNKYKINSSEIELLMERFDKNKDGMIDYKEFLNEISPMQ